MSLTASARPRADEAAREVRFAVVMYGGVSLAIYINGVAQELLRLVRATAPGAHGAPDMLLATDEELQGTERVYRRIARLLTADGSWSVGASGDSGPVTTRFVVDVLSGTSAGGINAVFLAKALATGRDIDALKSLWVEEGALEKLIFDGASEFDGVQAPASPPSLLNGRRMYRKLLDAFDAMDEGAAAPRALVPEVDLFVTTTDIAGLPIALRLADGQVTERRHRNVFHFRYPRDGTAACEDFAPDVNPFLAFVARCTSAFPFAFAPMSLRSTDDVLAGAPRHVGTPPIEDDGGRWRRFFSAYVGRDDSAAGGATASPANLRAAERLADRAFGDGGYLDNKPFGYAMDALSTRQPSVAVDRKLLYVEPSPEHPELDGAARAPNALENVHAALTLARYETIRDDLQRVLERNRLVERVERVLVGLDADIAAREPAGGPALSTVDYKAADVRAMIQAHGTAYGGYHRLKVSALTDEIAQYMAAAAGYDRQSDAFSAVRHLVAAWRSSRYGATADDVERLDARRAPGLPAAATENVYLLRYDLSYRRRRLDFVLGRIDRLLCTDAGAAAMLERLGLGPLPDGDACEPFIARLRELRHELGTSQRELQQLRADLLGGSRAPDAWIDAAKMVGLTAGQMRDILQQSTTAERVKRAACIIDADGLAPKLLRLEEVMAETIRAVTVRAADRCERALGAKDTPADRASPASVATVAAATYYYRYVHYDQLVFPAFFATGIGDEADVVDVHRISPEDATGLVNERDGRGARKLAGTTMANFGAFLDRRWRWNDLLWGRLDAAERLIHVLLPGGGEPRERARDAMVAEAHRLILAEEFGRLDDELLAEASVQDRIEGRAAPAADAPPTPAELMALPGSLLASALRAKLEPEALRAHFATSYAVKRELPAEGMLRLTARATRVTGRILRQIARERGRGSGAVGTWIARVGSLLWGLVEVAVPQSTAHLVARHAGKLLFVVGAFLVLAGTVVLNVPVQRFGIGLLLVTGSLHLATWIVRDRLQGHRRWVRALASAGILAVVLTTALGAWTLMDAALRSVVWARVMAWSAQVRWGVAGLTAGLLAVWLAGSAAMDWWRRRRAVAADELAAMPAGVPVPPGGRSARAADAGTPGAARSTLPYDRRTASGEQPAREPVKPGSEV